MLFFIWFFCCLLVADKRISTTTSVKYPRCRNFLPRFRIHTIWSRSGRQSALLMIQKDTFLPVELVYYEKNRAIISREMSEISCDYKQKCFFLLSCLRPGTEYVAEILVTLYSDQICSHSLNFTTTGEQGFNWENCRVENFLNFSITPKSRHIEITKTWELQKLCLIPIYLFRNQLISGHNFKISYNYAYCHIKVIGRKPVPGISTSPIIFNCAINSNNITVNWVSNSTGIELFRLSYWSTQIRDNEIHKILLSNRTFQYKLGNLICGASYNIVVCAENVNSVACSNALLIRTKLTSVSNVSIEWEKAVSSVRVIWQPPAVNSQNCEMVFYRVKLALMATSSCYESHLFRCKDCVLENTKHERISFSECDCSLRMFSKAQTSLQTKFGNLNASILYEIQITPYTKFGHAGKTYTLNITSEGTVSLNITKEDVVPTGYFVGESKLEWIIIWICCSVFILVILVLLSIVFLKYLFLHRNGFNADDEVNGQIGASIAFRRQSPNSNENNYLENDYYNIINQSREMNQEIQGHNLHFVNSYRISGDYSTAEFDA